MIVEYQVLNSFFYNEKMYKEKDIIKILEKDINPFFKQRELKKDIIKVIPSIQVQKKEKIKE